MTDIAIIETLNGGDIVLQGNDLATVEGFTNMPYLSCFGGNDWWGNDIIGEGAGVQYNGITEDNLNAAVINTSLPNKAERWMQQDLAYLNEQYPNEKIQIDVSIPAPNKINATIAFKGEQMYINWNPLPTETT